MSEDAQDCACQGDSPEKKAENCGCGCGDSCRKDDAENKTEPADGDKMLPVKQAKPEGCHGRKYSPWGVLIVIAVLGLLLWAVSGSKSYQGSCKLVPAGVTTMLSFNCGDDIRNKLAALPVWKDGKKSAQRVSENLASGFAGADKSGLWSELLGFCSWMTRARTADDSKIYILSTGNLHAVEDIVCNRIAKGFVKDRDTVTVEGINNVRKIQTPDGEYYFTKMGTNAVLADKVDTLAKIIRCYQEKEPSLASIGVGLDNDELQEIAYFSYFVPSRSDRSYFIAVVASLGGDNSCRKDAGVVTRVKLLSDGMVMQSRIVNNDEISEAGESHGFFYYSAVIIIWIVALVIGIPALFVMVTLAMAGYFYLVARWKGELVPIDPPELPEMSTQMKEDLQQKPVPDAKKESPAENNE